MTKVVSQCVLCGGAALALMGCGGDPLVGRWRPAASPMPLPNGIELSTLFELRTDGFAVTETTGAGSCAGQLRVTTPWRTAGNTITLDGTMQTCAGEIVCTVMSTEVRLDCATYGQGGTLFTGMYALSNGNNTLTLTSMVNGSTASATYTRVQ
jgi:hypothetical protein